MRAMCLAFSRDRLAWPFEEQFLCGDCLLIAPVKRPGGAVDVYLPRGDDWIDLNTGVQHAGGTFLSLRVDVATLPHFGRIGYVLPLGPEIDRVDAMNEAAPLNEAWMFGNVMHERHGFAQLDYVSEDGKLGVRCKAGMVRRF
jgi:alpha-D-xyloside xylohydrolase